MSEAADDVATSGDLLRAAAGGDQAAWDELVDRFTRPLWGIASTFRLSRDDTADAVQTTWLKLVENMTRIRDPDRVAGWLATTVRNQCLLTLRRAGRETPSADMTLSADPDPAPGDDLLRRERDAHLRLAFVDLSERCQRLLSMLLLADPPLDYQQVSRTLAMPVGSIGPTRARCLDHLRDNLAANGIESRRPTSMKRHQRDGAQT